MFKWVIVDLEEIRHKVIMQNLFYKINVSEFCEHFPQSSFPVIHKVGNVDIFVFA